MGNVRILSASAGSGKTYRLAYEYVRSVVGDPMSYRHILAVTFTNKATEEMKTRILREIDLLASGQDSAFLPNLMSDLHLDESRTRSRALAARTRILHDYSHFAVLTIDKFFQRIIRSFIRELGIELNFNIELKTETLLSSAADALIDEISTDDDIRSALFDLAQQRISENKRWNLKETILSLGGEIFKEEYRRATQNSDSEKLTAGYSVVESVVQKAEHIRHSMQERASLAVRLIEENSLCVSDFSGGSKGFASYFYKIAGGDISAYGKQVADALSPEAKWVSAAGKRVAGTVESLRPQLSGILSGLVSDYDRNVRFLKSASLLYENYRNFMLLSDLQRNVEQLCRQQNLLPISETNHILSKLVGDNDTPFIFEKVGNYYSQFMIDEFQDTSTSQWENFVPLLHNALSQTPDEPVLLVGDIKQSIYRWRGGDWQILASRVRQEFGAGRVVEENLGNNWRSLGGIVDFNNFLIGTLVENDSARLGDMLSRASESGALSRENASILSGMLSGAYANYRQHVVRAEGGLVTVTYYGQQRRRAQERQAGATLSDGDSQPPVIAAIEDLQRRGYGPEDIAILVRSNTQGCEIASILLDYKSRHPHSGYCYDVITQEALAVGRSPVVIFLIACLNLAVAGDEVQRAVYNSWTGKPYGEKLDADDAEFFSTLALLPLEEAFERILIRYRIWEREEDIAYIQALHQQILSFTSSKVADIDLFLKWWNEQGADESLSMQRSSSAITVTTIHKSKGLEYPAVIIPYCSWQLSPRSTIMWTQADSANPEWNVDGTVPVKYKKDVEASYFSQSYYRETVLSHIDNINLLYVAVTRAERELHIMIPRRELSSDSISTLVDAAVSAYGADRREFTDDIGNRVVEFGSRSAVPKKKRAEEPKSEYPTVRSRAAVSSRLASQRYFEDNAADCSPRNFGILMHKAFEGASDKEQVLAAVERMFSEGLVSASEAGLIKRAVQSAFDSNPEIRSWFSSDWEQVRFEDAIIIPGDTSQRRPDRVMINGDRAVVVDYKFGHGASAVYRRQVAEYMKLLGDMGYSKVEGYLWYVRSGEVERV